MGKRSWLSRIPVLVLVLVLRSLGRTGAEARVAEEALTGWWSFDEGTGDTARDLCGAGNDGKVHGAQWMAGIVGSALSFDGVDDYMVVSPAKPSLPFTLEFWAKPTTGSPVGMFDTAPGQRSAIRNYPAGEVQWLFGSGVNVTVPLGPLVAGEWYHLVFVFRQTDVAVIDHYRNGVLASSESGDYSPDYAWSSPLRFGDMNNGYARFKGLLDEVKIHNRALTQDEIYERYIGVKEGAKATLAPAILKFPTAGVAEFRFDTSKSELPEVCRISCLITDTGGKEVWFDSQPVENGKARFVLNGFGSLAVGDYTLNYSGLDAAGQVLTRSSRPVRKSRRPEWLNNSLGKQEVVPRPWTPVKVHSRNAFGVWGRRYVFGTLGFPASLIAVGEDLLKGPARLIAAVDGKPVAFLAAGSLRITPGKTRTIIEANSVAKGQARLTLKVKTAVEFDGFARVDVALRGIPGMKLDRFWLEMPLAKENALYHLPVESGSTPIPAGGLTAPILGAFDSATYRTTDLYWVGGDNRGLFWSAEDDRHWSLTDRNKAQALIPESDRVVWRLHFVDIPREMVKPLELTYCFMATPVKPVKDWYSERVARDVPTYGVKRDRPLRYAYHLGTRVSNYHETWTELMGYPGTFIYQDELKALIAMARDVGLRLCFYSNHVISELAPEFEAWGAQWSQQIPMAPFDTRQPPLTPQFQKLYRCTQTSSFADFYVYNWVQMIRKYGMGGMYLDGTFNPEPDTNPYFEHAYVSADGQIQPTRPIFAAREFMKRMYRACKAEDPNFYFFGHLADNYFMPTASFLDFTMGGENFALVPSDYELPWSYWRAANTGRQFGIIKEFLPGKFPESYLVPLALVHGVGVFATAPSKQPVWQVWDAFGIGDAEWVPYWRNSGLVTSSHPDVKVTYYKKPKQILLVAATNRHRVPEATITVDVKALGLEPPRLRVYVGLRDTLEARPDADGKLRLAFPGQTNYGGYLWLRSDG